MGMPKGSKIAENPKSIPLQIRIDRMTDEMINHIMKRENISKSEVVRRGIEIQYREDKTNEKK